MWANAVIGYDVVRTFIDHKSGRKNIYQLLQEGKLGEFDGKILAIGRELFEIVTATDGHDDEDGIEMYIGIRFAPQNREQSADGSTGNLDPAGNNAQGSDTGEEGSFDHTTPLSIEEFTRLHDMTRKGFSSVGIDISPGIFALTDEYCGGEDFDFFGTTTLEYLRKRISTDLEYGVHPFPYSEGSKTALPEEKEKVPLDTESIKKSIEYQFVMNKMGKGKKSKVVIDTKLTQLRDLEKDFLSSPCWVSGLEEIINLRKEIGINDDLPDFAKAVFQSYRKLGGWIVLDNLLLLEKELAGSIPAIETIVPEMSFWKQFREKFKGSDFFEIKGDPGKIPIPIKEYQDFFNSVKLVSSEVENRHLESFSRKYSSMSRFLDPADQLQKGLIKYIMQMGHSTNLDRLVDSFERSYCGKLHDRALDLMIDKKTNRFIQNNDSLEIFNFILSTEQPVPMKALTLYSRGLAYRTRKDMRSAVRDFDHSLHYNPGYGKAWYMRGRTLVDLEMTDDALVSFQNAIRHNESKAKSWGFIAAIHLDNKQLDKAYSALSLAYELEPENPIVVDLMKSEELNDHKARKRISERDLMQPPGHHQPGIQGEGPGRRGGTSRPQQSPPSGNPQQGANQTYPQQPYNQYQRPQQPYQPAYPGHQSSTQPQQHPPQHQYNPPGYTQTYQQPQPQHPQQMYPPYQQPQHMHPQQPQQYQAPPGYSPQQYPGTNAQSYPVTNAQQQPGQYPPGAYTQPLPYGAYQQPIEKKEKPTLQEFLNLVQGSTMHNMFWKLIFASIILQIIILSIIEFTFPLSIVMDFIVSMVPFIAMYLWLHRDIHQKASPDGYDITGYPVSVRMKSEMAWMIMILLFFGTLDILQALSELFDMEQLYWPMFFIWLIFWFKYMVAYIIRFFYKYWFTETTPEVIDLS